MTTIIITTNNPDERDAVFAFAKQNHLKITVEPTARKNPGAVKAKKKLTEDELLDQGLGLIMKQGDPEEFVSEKEILKLLRR